MAWRWQWEENGVWNPYRDSDGAKLEHEYQRDPNSSFMVDSFSFGESDLLTNSPLNTTLSANRAHADRRRDGRRPVRARPGRRNPDEH